jgi:hypothetical protein
MASAVGRTLATGIPTSKTPVLVTQPEAVMPQLCLLNTLRLTIDLEKLRIRIAGAASVSSWMQRASLLSLSDAVISSLVEMLRTRPFVASAPPPRTRARKNASAVRAITSGRSVKGGQDEGKRVISTTLQSIIATGDVQDSVTGVEELLMCVWQHSSTVMFLMQCAVDAIVENARIVHESPFSDAPAFANTTVITPPVSGNQLSTKSKPRVAFQEGSKVRPGLGAPSSKPHDTSGTSDEPKPVKVIPENGRVSVRTGRRLVGSTIARRFMASRGGAAKPTGDPQPMVETVKEDEEEEEEEEEEEGKEEEGSTAPVISNVSQSTGYYNSLSLLPYRVLCVTVEDRLIKEFASNMRSDRDMRRSHMGQGDSNVYVSIPPSRTFHITISALIPCCIHIYYNDVMICYSAFAGRTHGDIAISLCSRSRNH